MCGLHSMVDMSFSTCMLAMVGGGSSVVSHYAFSVLSVYVCIKYE